MTERADLLAEKLAHERTKTRLAEQEAARWKAEAKLAQRIIDDLRRINDPDKIFKRAGQ